MYFCNHRERTRIKIQTVTMSHQLKLNCPICNYPKLTNLSRHLTKVHGLSGNERKALLLRACFSVSYMHQIILNHLYQKQFLHRRRLVTVFQKHPHYLSKEKLPNPVPPNSTSDQTEDNLIPCPYDSCISYERIWGTNVPAMDYDIFKLHHPFSMLVAGPRGAGKSEFVKQLLSLKCFIMTNPPERIV